MAATASQAEEAQFLTKSTEFTHRCHISLCFTRLLLLLTVPSPESNGPFVQRE